MDLKIDRCICFNIRFADLKRVADSTGAETIDKLQEHVDFGTNCRLCNPYVRRMLKTGETVFATIIVDPPDEDDAK